MKHYDVMIVGGALVGSCMALALKARGLSVAIIEQKAKAALMPPEPLDRRYIALSHGSHLILKGLKIWEYLQPFTQTINDIHVSDRGYFGITRLSAKEQNLPALGFVIAFHDLLSQLNQLVCAKGIDCYTETQIEDCHLQEGVWQIACDGTAPQHFTSSLLIAADGMNSYLRAKFEIPTQRKDYGQTAIVANIRTDRHQFSHTAFERFTREGPMVVLPLESDQAAIIWTLNKAQAALYMDCSDEDFLSAFQKAFGYRLGRFTDIGKRQAFPLELVVSEDVMKPQLLLMGNALHNLHPVAAQGFNLALRDLAAFMDVMKRFKDDLTNEQLLITYAKERKKDYERTVRFTDGLVLLFSNDFAPVVFLRNCAMVAMECIPPLKHYVGRYGAGRLGILPPLARGLE